jgi:hypothetical protein
LAHCIANPLLDAPDPSRNRRRDADDARRIVANLAVATDRFDDLSLLDGLDLNARLGEIL